MRQALATATTKKQTKCCRRSDARERMRMETENRAQGDPSLVVLDKGHVEPTRGRNS